MIILAVLVILTIICMVNSKNEKLSWDARTNFEMGFAFSMAGTITVVLIAVIIQMYNAHSTAIHLNEKQNAIIYEIRDGMLDDDPVRVYQDIAEFNTEVSQGKHFQYNWITNIFTPQIYQNYEMFDYGLGVDNEKS